MVTIDVDVVIVGARVAGAITAIRLGRMGHRVLVVDTATFPCDTISTHFFRGAGMVAVLDRLGLLEDVLALGSPRLSRQYVFQGDDPNPIVEAPQDPGAAGYDLSVRRRALDQVLVSAARSTAGVEVWDGVPARGLVREDGRVRGIVVRKDGHEQTIAAQLVVGADGRGSSVARWVEAPAERREVATRAMYYRYVRGFRGPGGAPDGPVFSFRGDELAYAFPSDDGLTCLALSINLAAFAGFRTAPEPRFSERIAAHPGLADAYQAATPDGRLLGSGPKDALVRHAHGPGWVLVGDAGLSQDPWTGLGMDNAATHAMLLADAIDDWLTGAVDETPAMARYQHQRDEHALPGFTYTAEAGRDLAALGAEG